MKLMDQGGQIMPKPTTSGVRNSIVAANEQFVAAFSRGDAAAVAALYGNDAQVLPPNNDLISGQQAIETFWQGVMNIGIKAAKLDTVDVDGSGDIACEVGKYTLLGEGGQEIDTGKYVVVWKQEAGQWKLHRDIWNSSRPAPQ
jgi:uncharacterized protein (TIGR02246 family)